MEIQKDLGHIVDYGVWTSASANARMFGSTYL